MKTTPVKIWRRQKDAAALIGKQGTLLQWTIIRVPAKAFMREAPYPVGIIQMEHNERMIGQIVDWNEADLVTGRKMVAVLRRVTPEDGESVISYIIKFKPDEEL